MSAWRTSRSGNLLPCAHYFCGAHNSVSHPDTDVDPPAYVFSGACSLTLSLSTFSLYLSLLLFGVVRLSKKVSCLAGSVQLVTSLCLRLYLFGPDRDEKNLCEEREREREREMTYDPLSLSPRRSLSGMGNSMCPNLLILLTRSAMLLCRRIYQSLFSLSHSLRACNVVRQVEEERKLSVAALSLSISLLVRQVERERKNRPLVSL